MQERTDEVEKIIVKQMKRRDLAMKYFPESSPRAAVKALLRWIDNCSDLIKALD